MMRSMQSLSLNATLTLNLTEIPIPLPNEILVNTHACGLNFADLLMIKGHYQETPPNPITPGMEISGIVTAIGNEVQKIKIGDHIIGFKGYGGLADYITLPAANALKIPDALSFTTAAAFLVGYGTSHLALDHFAKLKPNERLLVLGASGGVGLTAVEIGAKMGAEVIGVARGEEKLSISKSAGAHHLIDANDPDLTAKIKALGGADVLYDPVGGALFDRAFKACNQGARILPIGFASGDIPQIPANILLVKNMSVIGYYWAGLIKLDPEMVMNSAKEALNWIIEGKITPHICATYPLEESNEALELLRARKSTGKIIINLKKCLI